MSTNESVVRTPYGVALHALSQMTGQPEHFFFGHPGDSSRTRGAKLEFVATLLLDLDDSDALTARSRTAPRPSLVALVEELEQAEDTAAGHGLDDEIAGGWAA
ncbi:hypothetical protein P1P68_02315 [Streptomyces scabiei]|uniref:hypothetical protein n=1 Tax=Streptomyces scabiei TaxID=1930 RepID=UPI00298FF807|nr:hypothetical protein [Streptomyces scabiei]MDW8803669.1 hypothetical protein [Streptomyces scabiei]